MATADGKTTIHFNTQPPEGGWFQREMPDLLLEVSTHSHPKVAAVRAPHFLSGAGVSTHSHPKVAAPTSQTARLQMPFQHTATRRWLLVLLFSKDLQQVSTHSHPKVAGNARAGYVPPKPFQHTATRRWLQGLMSLAARQRRFNTQPPEGGCERCRRHAARLPRFNTQPPEGGCGGQWTTPTYRRSFNTQPPEGGCL